MADTQSQAPVTREEFEQLKAALDSHAKENAALKAMVNKKADADEAPKEVPALPDDVFDVDGKKYKFVIRQFRLTGNGENVPSEPITAVDALTDTELLKQLVACKSGVIKAVA